MTTVFFCADDYALNAPISQAILNLLKAGRIQATSCMTQAPDWEIHGAKLRELKNAQPRLQIGLHLNMTHDFSDEMLFKPLGKLMLDAWFRQLSEVQIQQTLSYQWQRFIDVLGRAPDFIDGHQHVHQFPVIRDVLLTFLTNKGFSGWIRNLSHMIITPNFFIKCKSLSLLGAMTLADSCEELHFRQNARFAGVYDFKNGVPYSELMAHWLDRAKNTQPTISEDVQHSLLIMCHPSVDASDETDTIAQARVREYNYFKSDQFGQDCADRFIAFTKFVAKRPGEL
jgi:predicted glycoside hydrolase/deacetylase ChbG (UPF0249 family)